ncbi:hypothetical protein BMF94_7032 [Rhodotorula taiwanensis]|uniref:Anaphase-promoting complex subunit 11 n=1 Tax=Rhodotorula taiwanensis TaxID=741276 RepID=A0A2S5AZM1_9BASI|nr:hypothetical protein BMF94_7032 [Rhodotorula taiwanensis]
MKVTINHYHAVATWKWNLKPNHDSMTDDGAAPSGGRTEGAEGQEDDDDDDDDDDDVCGICRVAFDGCCPDCKIPGDGCPPVWGECTHVFHLHCLTKWLATESSKGQCPMDRRQWITAGSPGGVVQIGQPLPQTIIAATT